jgi:hypothetical protein
LDVIGGAVGDAIGKVCANAFGQIARQVIMATSDR